MKAFIVTLLLTARVEVFFRQKMSIIVIIGV